jgi:hypothetical protein
LKKLKYNQMVAIREAGKTTPQLSETILIWNMKLHDSPTKTTPPEHISSFQHQVYRSLKKVCTKQSKGFEFDDSYCKLDEFAESNMWSALVHRSERWPPHWLP